MNVEIAQRLAELRREKGYSQEELAENLGLSRQAVSKWERAESSPDTGNLVALAKLYGVTLDELLKVEEDIVDILFESKDRSSSEEARTKMAVEEATAAAVQASLAASQAVSIAEQAAAVSQPAQNQSIPQSGFQPAPQPGFPSTPQPVPHPASQPLPQSEYVFNEEEYLREETKRKKGPWMTFPYPVLCVIVFLGIGFLSGAWHPGWLVFLTVPLYYWMANIIEHDPNYRKTKSQDGE